MKLEQVSVRSFGLLRNYTVNFENGLNIVEGGNETGKTTLAAFIRFMLYGFDESEGLLSEREKRINWQTGTAEGSMTLSTASGRYRIDRRVARHGEGDAVRYTETCEVTDLGTSRPVNFGMTPGEALLGVGRSLYESTAFLGQLSDGKTGDEVRESIENLMFSGDEKINTGAAIERLSAARDSLLAPDGKSGRLRDVEARSAALASRFSAAMRGQSELLRLRGEYERTVVKRDDAKKQLARTQELKIGYRNHLILSSFEELHTMERQAADLEEEIRDHRERNSYEGFFPDDTYAADLAVKHRLFSESRTAYEAADNAQRELESKQAVPHDVQKNIQRTDKYGGEGQVLARHAALHSKFLVLLSSTLGVTVLLAILLAVGISRFLASSLTGAPFVLWLIGSIGLFVGAVVLTLLTINRHETERAYCLDYGARGAAELRARMKLVSEYRVSAAAHVDALRAARERADDTRGAYFTARGVLDEALALWGKALPAAGDAEEFLGIFEGSVRDAIQTDRELTERRAALLNTAGILKTTLASCDENALRATLPERLRATLSETTPEQIDEGIAYYTEQLQYFTDSAEGIRQAMETLHTETEIPAEVGEQLSAAENELAELRRRYTALDTALSALTGADLRLRAELSPRLAHYAKELVDIMTDGKYTAMTVGDDLTMTFPGAGATRSVDVLSGGTRDIAYIALRLSLVRLLFREMPPVCFDESFAHQDNDRCYAMLKVFSALSERDGMQTFVFTCRGREYTVAREIGGACNLIRMV